MYLPGPQVPEIRKISGTHAFWSLSYCFDDYPPMLITSRGHPDSSETYLVKEEIGTTTWKLQGDATNGDRFQKR